MDSLTKKNRKINKIFYTTSKLKNSLSDYYLNIETKFLLDETFNLIISFDSSQTKNKLLLHENKVETILFILRTIKEKLLFSLQVKNKYCCLYTKNNISFDFLYNVCLMLLYEFKGAFILNEYFIDRYAHLINNNTNHNFFKKRIKSWRFLLLKKKKNNEHIPLAIAVD